MGRVLTSSCFIVSQRASVNAVACQCFIEVPFLRFIAMATVVHSWFWTRRTINMFLPYHIRLPYMTVCASGMFNQKFPICIARIRYENMTVDQNFPFVSVIHACYVMLNMICCVWGWPDQVLCSYLVDCTYDCTMYLWLYRFCKPRDHS